MAYKRILKQTSEGGDARDLQYRDSEFKVKKFEGRTFTAFSIKGLKDEGEVEKIREVVHQDGVLEGKREGQKEILGAINAVAKAVQDVSAHKAKLIEGSKKEIIALVFAISKKVIDCELRIKPEHVMANIKKALERTAEWQNVLVYLHPEDAELVEGILKRESDKYEIPKEVRFERDSKVKRGGCYIRGDRGEIDARVETLLRNISGMLKEEQLMELALKESENSDLKEISSNPVAGRSSDTEEEISPDHRGEESLDHRNEPSSDASEKEDNKDDDKGDEKSNG